jgi:hypothetical protein
MFICHNERETNRHAILKDCITVCHYNGLISNALLLSAHEKHDEEQQDDICIRNFAALRHPRPAFIIRGTPSINN